MYWRLLQVAANNISSIHGSRRPCFKIEKKKACSLLAGTSILIQNVGEKSKHIHNCIGHLSVQVLSARLLTVC